MITKDTLVRLFTQFNGVNFTINTNASYSLGINGTEYETFFGYEDNYEDNDIKTCEIISVLDDGILVKATEDHRRCVKNVFIPYSVITTIEFFENDYNNGFCSYPKAIEKNKLFTI